MHGSVLATLPKALLAYLKGLDHDAGAIEREAGLDPAMWHDPEARVPREQVDALWAIASRVTGDAALGVHFAFTMPAGNAGVLETVTQTAPTAEVSLQHVCRYWHLLNDGIDLVLEHHEDRVELHLRTRSSKPLAREWIDLTVVALAVLGTRALAEPHAPMRIDLPYPETPSVAELGAVVGAPLYYGAEHLVIAYPRAALRAPLVAANPALHAIAAAHAEALLDSAEDKDFVARIRRAIEQRLEQGDANLSAIAEAAGLTARTLQRRLKEHGTSLRAVVDEARRNIALAEIARGDRSFTDVAFLLGFSEASAFNRAFRRWTGASPTEYLRRSGR